MLYYRDTIAAISTPTGYGGISIIRVSGVDAFEVVNKIFRRPNGKTFLQQGKSTIHYGHIVDEEGNILDEVLVSKMPAPHTFTAEDVAEINCHGGIVAVRRVLELVTRTGARLAQPGEFTKRAFLNGRIDLSQAEAISDVITAKTNLAANAAIGQLTGVLSQRINDIKQKILTLISNIEVTIQYPEYDVEDVTDEELLSALREIKGDIQKLLKTYKQGEILREGLKVAICGKPNVGKSMMLNALLNEEKAIVTDIAGTTRDIVDEYISLSGLPVRIIDTAGIRESTDVVEKIGIDRSVKAANEADLVLFLCDCSKPLTDEDEQILSILEGKNVIHILNKTDLGINDGVKERFKDTVNLETSALTKENIDRLEEMIISQVLSTNEDVMSNAVVTSVRHKGLLDDALSSVTQALDCVEMGYEIDLIQVDINDCWASLGNITGQAVTEDIIDEIFANFCLGK